MARAVLLSALALVALGNAAALYRHTYLNTFSLSPPPAATQVGEDPLEHAHEARLETADGRHLHMKYHVRRRENVWRLEHLAAVTAVGCATTELRVTVTDVASTADQWAVGHYLVGGPGCNCTASQLGEFSAHGAPAQNGKGPMQLPHSPDRLVSFYRRVESLAVGAPAADGSRVVTVQTTVANLHELFEHANVTFRSSLPGALASGPAEGDPSARRRLLSAEERRGAPPARQLSFWSSLKHGFEDIGHAIVHGAEDVVHGVEDVGKAVYDVGKLLLTGALSVDDSHTLASMNWNYDTSTGGAKQDIDLTSWHSGGATGGAEAKFDGGFTAGNEISSKGTVKCVGCYFHASVGYHLALSVEHYRLQSAELVATAQAGAGIGVDADGSFDDTVTVGEELGTIDLGRFDFAIGDIPVTVKIDMPVAAGVKLTASTEGRVSFSLAGSATFQYGVAYDTTNHWHSVHSREVSFSVHDSVNADMKLAVKPFIQLKPTATVDFVMSAFATVTPYVEVDGTTSVTASGSSSSVGTDGCYIDASASVGVDLALGGSFGLDVGSIHLSLATFGPWDLLDVSKRVWGPRCIYSHSDKAAAHSVATATPAARQQQCVEEWGVCFNYFYGYYYCQQRVCPAASGSGGYYGSRRRLLRAPAAASAVAGGSPGARRLLSGAASLPGPLSSPPVKTDSADEVLGWLWPSLSPQPCPNGCSGKGVCVNGTTCQCQVGSGGQDCSRDSSRAVTVGSSAAAPRSAAGLASSQPLPQCSGLKHCAATATLHAAGALATCAPYVTTSVCAPAGAAAAAAAVDAHVASELATLSPSTEACAASLATLLCRHAFPHCDADSGATLPLCHSNCTAMLAGCGVPEHATRRLCARGSAGSTRTVARPSDEHLCMPVSTPGDAQRASAAGVRLHRSDAGVPVTNATTGSTCAEARKEQLQHCHMRAGRRVFLSRRAGATPTVETADAAAGDAIAAAAAPAASGGDGLPETEGCREARRRLLCASHVPLCGEDGEARKMQHRECVSLLKLCPQMSVRTPLTDDAAWGVCANASNDAVAKQMIAPPASACGVSDADLSALPEPYSNAAASPGDSATKYSQVEVLAAAGAAAAVAAVLAVAATVVTMRALSGRSAADAPRLPPADFTGRANPLAAAAGTVEMRPGSVISSGSREDVEDDEAAAPAAGAAARKASI